MINNNELIDQIKSYNRFLNSDSLNKAYNFALDKEYDYLITMDADLSHDPSELSNFINNLEIYPFVIGSRYISGGK